MSIEAVTMVVATCDRCGDNSQIIPESEAGSWLQKHEKMHQAEDRVERMRRLGHDCRTFIDWMDMDDSSGHAECSCGWRSRDAKHLYAPGYRDEHLVEVEKLLLDAWAQAA